MTKKQTNLKISGIAGIVIFLSLILFLIVNVNAPITLTQQTTLLSNGTITTPVIVKNCQSVPAIPGNTACLISNNIVNGTSSTSTVTTKANTVSNASIVVPVKPSENIQLQPIITITDNAGKTTPITTSAIPFTLNSFLGSINFQMFARSPALSYIAQTGNNDPVSNGQLNLGIQLHASPNEFINGNGTLWVALNGNNINPQGIPWVTRGTTDSNGNLNAVLSTPIGILANYTFNIAANAPMINQPSNSLVFSVSNVSIQNPKGLSYTSGFSQQTIFQTSFNYDPNLVISQNSQGNYVVIYPSDDTLTINSVFTQTTFVSTSCHTYGPGRSLTCGANRIYSGQAIVGPISIIPYGSNIALASGSSITVSTETVGISGVSGITSNGGIGQFTCSSGTDCSGNIISQSETITGIPRNATINISIGGTIPPFSQTIHTSVSQESHSYNCGLNGCTFS